MQPINHPAGSGPAWDEAATHRAWKKLFTLAVLGQLLWPVVFLGTFILAVFIGQWSLWVLMPISVYALYRAFLQRQYILAAVQARRLLKVYAWRVHQRPESGIGQIEGAKLGDVWLAFPDPDQDDRDVPIILHGHARSVWWRRRLGRGYETAKTLEVADVWFAGDPRFAGVIAVPGPRRLFLIYQLKESKATASNQQSASEEALVRARRAGVRV